MKKLIQDNVALAFRSLGDLLNVAYYRPAGIFDPATNVLSVQPEVTVRCVAVSYSTREIDGSVIKSGDLKAIFELASLDIDLQESGALRIYDQVWQIKNISRDPADATLTVQLRR